jgi:subtilisin family serine protease
VRHRPALVAALLAALLIAAQGAPNDPHFSQQWGLQRINAPEAWQLSRGEGIVVAVVDSGVDLRHPDLLGGFARDADGRVLGRDLVDGGEPVDEHGHGTMVAGIVAARSANGIGVASVAPLAQIMPVRVLDSDAAGTSGNVDAGIRWAVDNGADVVNLSLEIAREEGADASATRARAPAEAVSYAWDNGVVVVAAAGNHASDFTDYPDDSPVLIVGATDLDDERAGFSDTGRPDAVVAPGVGIVSTWCNPCGADPEHTIGMSDGTSYASAHVAGTVALLLSAGVSPQDAVRLVRETATDLGPGGPDPEYGHGLIDAVAAVRTALDELDQASTATAPTDGQQAAGERPTPAPTPGDDRALDVPDDDRDVTGWAAVAAGLLLVDIAALGWWRARSWPDGGGG